MDNIWQRRSKQAPTYRPPIGAPSDDATRSSAKLTLTTSSSSKDGLKTDTPRTHSATKRFGDTGSAHSRVNPFNAVAANANAAIASPTGASSAFGLGTGAFASFGSASKAPKTPGATATTPETNGPTAPKDAKDNAEVKSKVSASTLSSTKPPAPAPSHPLKNSWVVWYRPPTAKHLDYEKSTIALASFGSAEAFWTVYAHLKRPSALPTVSDYHLFKKGVRPVWEDAANKRGGKWIVRLKKGVADRYWEDLLLAIAGDQFGEAGEEVCGAVLSVRGQEDVLSVWTRIDGGRNIKIRETIKHLLAFPPDTNIVWKSHDDSIAQRSAFDQARQEKANGHVPKRRDTLVEETTPEKARS